MNEVKVSRKTLTLPKKLTAYARPKTLGEHKAAFLSANLSKTAEEIQEEHDGSVSSWKDLALIIRDQLTITHAIINEWRDIANKNIKKPSGEPTGKQEAARVISNMLGFETKRDFRKALGRCNNFMHNPRYQAPVDRMLPHLTERLPNLWMPLVDEFIKKNNSTYDVYRISGQMPTDILVGVLTVILGNNFVNRWGATRSEVNNLANRIVEGSKELISKPSAEVLIVELLGWHVYEWNDIRAEGPKAILPFKYTREDYTALTVALNQLSN
jgi:hypothetical protein